MYKERIPKKIHFTWFSNDPYPSLVNECMATWRGKLPDYEFVHWDMSKIQDIDNLFLRQALEKRKWAFAADFVRLYALYHEGGIYLDTDVEVYKSFNDLLNLPAFIGRENSFHEENRRGVRYLTSHCMGGERHHPFFKACLDYYDGRPFVLSSNDWLPDKLKYDQTILPLIQKDIAVLQGYNPSEKIKGIQELHNGLRIFPYEYFDCHYQVSKSYCRHLALGGWRGSGTKAVSKIKDGLKARAYITVSGIFGLFNLCTFRKY